jgi:hypothetical protein
MLEILNQHQMKIGASGTLFHVNWQIFMSSHISQEQMNVQISLYHYVADELCTVLTTASPKISDWAS